MHGLRTAAHRLRKGSTTRIRRLASPGGIPESLAFVLLALSIGALMASIAMLVGSRVPG